MILVCYYFQKNWTDTIFLGALLTYFALDDYRDYKKRQSYLAGLQREGLTEEMAEQKAFLREWESIGKRGIFFYCLVYKSIPLTVLFTFLLAILSLIIVGFFLKTPLTSQILTVIMVCGYILGIIASKFLWSVNQKKFARLTDGKQ